MDNTREQSQDEQRRQFQNEANFPISEKTQLATDHDRRHYEPIEAALKGEASGYEWKRESGDIQSYQHNQSGSWLHIDHQGQFYDRQAQPIAKEHAFEHTGHLAAAVNEISQTQSIAKGAVGSDQGLSL